MKIVREYVDDVLSGEIIASKWVKLACQRHVDDLKDAGQRGYYFDEDKAFQACSFYPLFLRHSTSVFDDQPFKLSPWQAFCEAMLSGWRRIDTKRRRFRKAYITVARKNGKTTWMAGKAIAMTYADGEARAENYIGASKLSQASILYDEAKRMVQKSPHLAKRTRIRAAPPSNGIWDVTTDSVLKPVGGDKTNSGLNPHLVVMDELHAWVERHRPFKNELETGSGIRPQPLFVMITTAGTEQNLIWADEDKHATAIIEAVAAKQIIDDSYFAYIARLDPDDDPFEPMNWIKANPNLGVTVHAEDLQRDADEAKHRPTEKSKFLQFKCNVQVTSTERALEAVDWAKGNQPLSIEAGAYGHGGIDLALSRDFCALSAVFPIRDADGKTIRWEVLSKSFCVSGGSLRVDREPYRTWIREGMLEVHKGETFEQDEIKKIILDWHAKYNIQTWAYDPAHASLLGDQLLNEHGIPVFKFTQVHRFYNEPCERFAAAVKAGQIIHGGDPVLAWQAINLEWDRNSANLVMPDKSKRDNKIDAMVATIMAFSECLFAEKGRASYYDSNGLEMQ